MLNRIVLIGRLVRDPESSYTGGGIPVARFTIAVDRYTKNAETGLKETDFIDCVAWRQRADFVTSYVKKGRLVAVEGRLQIRQWEAQDGSRRRTAEVQVDSIEPLDRPRDTEEAAPLAHADDPGPDAPAHVQAQPRPKPAAATPGDPAQLEGDEYDPFEG